MIKKLVQSAIIGMAISALIKPNSVEASCLYAVSNSANYTCPAPTPMPSGQVQGSSSWKFEDFIGIVNPQGPFNNGRYDAPERWPQYNYLRAVFKWAHIHHGRNQINRITDPVLKQVYLNLWQDGFDQDMLYNPKEYGYGPYGNTDAGAAHYVSDLVASMPVGLISHLEMANELDAEDNGQWLVDTPDWTKNIFYYGQQTYQNLKNIPIIAGTYASFNKPVPGVSEYLTQYVNYGGLHIYQQGFWPENTTGFGGFGYNTFAGTMQFAKINGTLLTPNIPNIVTEFGYTGLTYPNSNTQQLFTVPEDIRTKYILRSWLHMFGTPSLGIKRAYIYSSMSEQDYDPYYYAIDSAWGLIHDPSSYQPRAVMLGLGKMLNILHDDHGTPSLACQPNVGQGTPFYTPGPTPTAPATPTPAPSAIAPESVTLCKSTGEVDTVLWLPAKSWDAVVLTYYNIPASYVNFSPNPAPSVAMLWTLNPTTGDWTPNRVNLASPIPITDTPSILAYNGPASPTPFPAYPTVPTPFQTPYATPTPAVTPTPGPTATPSSVSIVLATNSFINYFPTLTTIWGTPAPQPTITQAPTNAYYGTSSSITSTTLRDNGANWATNNYAGYTIYTGSSQGVVVSNTSNTLTISNWTGGTPSSGITYSVALIPAVPAKTPHPYNTATPTVAATPKYGDYNFTGINITQNSYPRDVLVPAPGYTALSTPYPQGTSGTDGTVSSALKAQSYGSYITNQLGGPFSDAWIVQGGYYNSQLSYELRGVDASHPIGAITWSDGTNGYAPCGNVTAPRAGSLVIALVYTAIGLTGFPWPNDQIPTSWASGWAFDGAVVPEYSSVYGFHRIALTNAGETVSGLQAAIARNPLAGQSPQYLYSPSICEMAVIQPPL